MIFAGLTKTKSSSQIKQKFGSCDSNFFVLLYLLRLLVLVFGKDDPVEVATYKVSKDSACVNSKEFQRPAAERNCHVIECICNAVSKSADNEERHCKEKREDVLLSCECHSSCHEHTTTDTEKAAIQCSSLESEFHDIDGSSLNSLSHW